MYKNYSKALLRICLIGVGGPMPNGIGGWSKLRCKQYIIIPGDGFTDDRLPKAKGASFAEHRKKASSLRSALFPLLCNLTIF